MDILTWAWGTMLEPLQLLTLQATQHPAKGRRPPSSPKPWTIYLLSPFPALMCSNHPQTRLMPQVPIHHTTTTPSLHKHNSRRLHPHKLHNKWILYCVPSLICTSCNTLHPEFHICTSCKPAGLYLTVGCITFTHAFHDQLLACKAWLPW